MPVCGWHFCHPKGRKYTKFPQHITGDDPVIQFTVENNKEDGTIPFLDTIVKPETDGKLSITVYRKPTHTDQYFQWDSYHHLSAKYSVISTLTHMAKTICNNPELLKKEMEYLRKALTNCKYPKWAFDEVEKRLIRSSCEVNSGDSHQGTVGTQSVTNEVKTKGYMVIPYSQSLCKSIKKICGRYVIQTHFKGNSTIKNLLVSPRTKTLLSNNPTLNKNIGKFNLPNIWDRVLFNTPGLTLKMHVQAVGHANSNQHNTSTQLNQTSLPT